MDRDDSDDIVATTARIVSVRKKHTIARSKGSKGYDLLADHAIEQLPIKRQRDEDDPNSVDVRQGMRLSPPNTLNHTRCGTH